MNQPFTESCMILSRASAQIYTHCATHAAQALGTAMLSGSVPSWRQTLDRTLALTSDCMRESNAALDAVWRVQRASLDLNAIALTLRTLQSVEADRASAQSEMHASLAEDCTKQVAEWLDSIGKARDPNDLLLGTAESAQAWQEAFKRFGAGYAGLAVRTMSAALQGLRSSVQDSAAKADAEAGNN